MKLHKADIQEVEDKNEVKDVRVDPRIYANGFPKSGTHLLELMVKGIAYPVKFQNDKWQQKGPWAGCFQDHSWTTSWAPTPRIFRRLGLLRDGTYLKGHMGYRHDIEMFLWGIGAAHVFIYRDPRDVAVSLTHHIITEDGSHSHPEWYKELGFDGALTAVIEGLKQYAGVLERWNEYAEWLECEWTLSIKFEDAIHKKEDTCGEIIRYVIGHNARFRGFEATIEPKEYNDAVDRMVKFSEMTDRSPTYRKGETGGWKNEFTSEHVRKFKEQDERWSKEYGLDEPWLVHLGYEEKEDW